MSVVMPKDPVANAKARRRLLWDGAHVPGAAKAIREQCAMDILFYVNAFCFTFDPRRREPVVPFITYPYQDEAILELQAAIREGRDVAVEKSRDMGASWINDIVVIHPWHFESNKNFLLVSRNESYVDEKGNPKSLFWKLDFLLKHQPRWLRPRNVTRTSMHLENGENGSVISGESTTGEVGRGDRRTAILMDEFAAFETKSGYNALNATQSTTNCRIFNSTPKGIANAFYDVCFKTSAKVIRMHWSEHPEKARGLYCSERGDDGKMVLRVLSGWKGVAEVCRKGEKEVRKVAFPEDYPFILDGKMRSPWYDRECSRAVSPVEIAQELDIDFTGSDYQFFDPVALEHYRDRWCRDPEAVGDLEIDDSACEVIRFSECPKGRFSLFEKIGDEGRVDSGRRFVIGVDVSAGTGASNSTCAIYDRRTTEKVAEYANPNVLPDQFGRIVVAMARFFNDAKVVPDRSGPTGEVLVRRMLAEGYTNIYVRRNTKKFGAPATDEPGVFLNASMRTTVLQQYRDAIGRVSLINRSATAIDECSKFIMKLDGTIEHSASSSTVDPSGARSNHGDMVIADALANLELSEGGSRDVPQLPEAREGTLAWRMEIVRREMNETRLDRLGKEWKA